MARLPKRKKPPLARRVYRWLRGHAANDTDIRWNVGIRVPSSDQGCLDGITHRIPSGPAFQCVSDHANNHLVPAFTILSSFAFGHTMRIPFAETLRRIASSTRLATVASSIAMNAQAPLIPVTAQSGIGMCGEASNTIAVATIRQKKVLSVCPVRETSTARSRQRQASSLGSQGVKLLSRMRNTSSRSPCRNWRTSLRLSPVERTILGNVTKSFYLRR